MGTYAAEATMPSFSLKWMLAGVAAVALGCVAMVYASPGVATITRGLVILLVLFAPLGVVYRTGGRRAFWLGFAVFGFGYIVVFGGYVRYRVGSKIYSSPIGDALNSLYYFISGTEAAPDIPIHMNAFAVHMVGNHLFILVLAFLGGILGRVVYATRDRSPEAGEP